MILAEKFQVPQKRLIPASNRPFGPFDSLRRRPRALPLSGRQKSIVQIRDVVGFDEVADLQKMSKEVITTMKTSAMPMRGYSLTSSCLGTELTFTLRDGVKWHDGKPFTAADVKCTYDLLIGKAKEKLRLNYREAWFLNLDEITTNGDREVAFHLKRPQPAFISLLASGYSPIYPCHISARDMRTHPVGTGPFKCVEYKPNQSIKVARNPDYWKPAGPR